MTWPLGNCTEPVKSGYEGILHALHAPAKATASCVAGECNAMFQTVTVPREWREDAVRFAWVSTGRKVSNAVPTVV